MGHIGSPVCGMLVAGGFCYRMLVDESLIARESQNSPGSCACLRPAPQHLESWLLSDPTLRQARRAG